MEYFKNVSVSLRKSLPPLLMKCPKHWLFFLRQADSIVPICRDSDDDLILACAGDAVADYVVTGDEDLLVLKNYEDISILNPREFEKLFPD
jgi:predicted nucleic acid-binding protein